MLHGIGMIIIEILNNISMPWSVMMESRRQRQRQKI